MEKTFIINGTEIKVQNFSQKGDKLTFSLGVETYTYRLVDRNGPELVLENGVHFRAAVGTPNSDGESMVIAAGKEALVAIGGKRSKKERAHVGGLTSPMPGKIFKIIKPVGSKVKKGETVLVLEAMKMEHSIRADKDGVVKKLAYKEGELAQGGVLLVELE